MAELETQLATPTTPVGSTLASGISNPVGALACTTALDIGMAINDNLTDSKNNLAGGTGYESGTGSRAAGSTTNNNRDTGTLVNTDNPNGFSIIGRVSAVSRTSVAGNLADQPGWTPPLAQYDSRLNLYPGGSFYFNSTFGSNNGSAAMETSLLRPMGTPLP